MQVAFYLAGEITQVKESIPWVRCASGNVFNEDCVPSGHMWGPIDMVCHRKQEYFPLVTSSEKLYLDNVIHKSG